MVIPERIGIPATHHWIDQGLVSISQVCREPSRRLLEGFRGPLSIGNIQWFEASVLFGGILKPEVYADQHGRVCYARLQTYIGMILKYRCCEKDWPAIGEDEKVCAEQMHA